MSFLYVFTGIKHFVDAKWFMQIMPPYLPWHLELVYLSGFFEILLGALLLLIRMIDDEFKPHTFALSHWNIGKGLH